MNAFDEGAIRRGQPDNAGKFRSKENTAPGASLVSESAVSGPTTDEAHAWQQGHCDIRWAANSSVVIAERRARIAELNEFMATAYLHAPEGAVTAEFDVDTDSYPRLARFMGDYFEPLEVEAEELTFLDLESFGVEEGISLSDYGFTQTGPLAWSIPLEQPRPPRHTPAADSGNAAFSADRVDASVGGDGSLGAFLTSVARRNAGVTALLDRLDDAQKASLNRDFEAFAALTAQKIAGWHSETSGT